MSLLRPIQYTGRLVGGLRRFQRRAGGGSARRRCRNELRGLLGVRDAVLRRRHAAGEDQGGGQHEHQRGAAERAALLTVELTLPDDAVPSCTAPRLAAMFASAVLTATVPVLRLPGDRPATGAPEFQHCTPAAPRGDSGRPPELQRERYEADTKLIPYVGDFLRGATAVGRRRRGDRRARRAGVRWKDPVTPAADGANRRRQRIPATDHIRYWRGPEARGPTP